MEHTNLQTLINTITSKWKFTPEKYQAMKHMDDAQKKTFMFSHVLHHINKSTGVIAAACEAFDHDNSKLIQDDPEIRKALIKTLTNVLLLMGHLNMPEEEIVQTIESNVK